jgi:hypothetical protein
MKNIHLFVTFNKGQTTFRVTGLHEGDITGGNPASTHNYLIAKEDHYANLAGYVKMYEPTSIEIRNELLSFPS